jgi:hypothetical protein
MMGKKKTDAEYRTELKEKHPDIEVLTFYAGTKTKLKFKHLTCGTEWWALPNSVLNSKIGCPFCNRMQINKDKIPSLASMLKELEEVWHGLIQYVCGYEKYRTKCTWRCVLDGHVWDAPPSRVLRQKKGCNICSHKIHDDKLTTPFEERLEQVKEIHGDAIKCLSDGSDYENVKSRCDWHCNECGYEWDSTMNNVLRGCGCPMCSIHSMERPVLELLKKKNINPIHNRGIKGCKLNKYHLKFDFIIETKNGTLIIETDGQQHFNPIHGKEKLITQKERDECKNKFCKDNNIILIRVTSSHNRIWGTPRHLIMVELFDLINKGISDNGEVNLDVFRPYDFNRTI